MKDWILFLLQLAKATLFGAIGITVLMLAGEIAFMIFYHPSITLKISLFMFFGVIGENMYKEFWSQDFTKS